MTSALCNYADGHAIWDEEEQTSIGAYDPV
jgi:hypothetical protein